MFASVTQTQAASTILFDTNGAAAGGVISVNTFDWLPDNALAQGSITTGGIITNTPFNVFAQGKLGSFVMPGNVAVTPTVGEFTFIASFQEQATLGGAAAAFTVLPGGSIRIFFDPSTNSNQLAGTGYDDGTLILRGVVAGGTGAFSDVTRLAPSIFPNVPIDDFGTNDYPGVLTHQGNGSNTLNVDVTFADPNFFLTPVSNLAVDANDTGNLAAPFNQANPAARVGTVIPVRGTGGVNGGDCPGTCDFQFQTDNATSFNVAPEPASAALIALGLFSFVAVARKRTKVTTPA